MTPEEKAVIDAARALAGATADDELLTRLLFAVEAWEKAQDPEVQEVGWHEVCEGDQLKSVKTGKFYPVLRVDSIRGGKRKITIVLSQGRHTTIERPAPDEPTALVKRGAAGKAVDIFVDVFSSGGK